MPSSASCLTYLQLGPFVDALHPKLVNGEITQTPVEIWRDQVGARLQRLVELSPGTHIILVPSTRDIVLQHTAFPQAMFDRDSLGIIKVSQACSGCACLIFFIADKATSESMHLLDQRDRHRSLIG